ncbi:MAG: efflux transporter periplasmic adaptor subunit, partial [Methylophilaceae bacterium]
MKIKYLLIMLVVFLGACSEKSDEAEAQRINPNEVVASDSMLQQIKFQQAIKIPIKRSLDIPGSIEVKQNLLARIGSPVQGRIIEISGMLGQTVKQGDV